MFRNDRTWRKVPPIVPRWAASSRPEHTPAIDHPSEGPTADTHNDGCDRSAGLVRKQLHLEQAPGPLRKRTRGDTS